MPPTPKPPAALPSLPRELERITADLTALSDERRLLGHAILSHPLPRDILALDERIFTEPTHQALWSAIRSLALAGEGLGSEQLATFGGSRFESFGGRSYLNDLCQIAEEDPSSANIPERIAAHLSDLARRRHLIGAAIRLLEDTVSDQPPEVAQAHAASALAAAGRLALDQSRDRADIRHQIASDLSRPTTVFSTSYELLDAAMGGGAIPGHLYAFSAEAKTGKTLLLSSLYSRMADRGTRLLYVTLKQPASEIEARSLARAIDANAMELLLPDREQLASAADRAAQATRRGARYIYMPRATTKQIEHAILDALRRHRIDGFLLDDWQRVAGRQPGDTEESHLRRVAYALDQLCKDHGLFGLVGATAVKGRTYQGEGLDSAASISFKLHHDLPTRQAWLSITASRYTEIMTIGTHNAPAFYLDVTRGPQFIEWSEYLADETLNGRRTPTGPAWPTGRPDSPA